MSLRQFRIGQRLALAFGVLIALMVVGAAFTAFELTQLRGHQQEIAAQLQRGQQPKADEAMARLDQTLSTATSVLSFSTVVGIIAAALLGVAITRSVTRPLVATRAAAERMADGDLSAPVLADGRDEVTELQQALSRMQQVLGAMVGEVRVSTESMAAASAEIASGNLDLSTRTEQTAGNLQQAASSLEQLTGTVGQTADSARTANQLAAAASTAAQHGGEVVAQVVSTMNEIQVASRRIADIIGTIDGIAFQTNILALNAAVEAARAGEQGRGFAVVAGEVRTLAQRSAEAAREIKGLIGASVEKVDNGTRLVNEAGSAMEQIVSGVRRVTDVIGEISAAATEQSGGLRQVNEAVAQLDQMTHQNAALVEQSAAAAQSMAEQSRRLTQAVSRFRGGSGGGAALGPAVPAPQPPAARPVAAATPAKGPAASPKALAVQTLDRARTVARAPASASPGDDWETF
ncbi:MAG: methyl-accepting chemotaxis protein [Betaproteobacteria bacterium]